MNGFAEDIRKAINCASRENGSNTPDFVLASYLISCLDAFDAAVNARAPYAPTRGEAAGNDNQQTKADAE